MVAIGDRNGHVGIGLGGAKETVPAREKAVRQAKLHTFKIKRGCGSWQCNCRTPHSIPFTVSGKSGSVIMTLIPAPKGKGLCIEKECAKVLALAGIRDVWSKTQGQTSVKVNLIRACEAALRNLSRMKLAQRNIEHLAVLDGGLRHKTEQKAE
jgi:small subunit ribosomal protein S5